jgi:hypothetical protein
MDVEKVRSEYEYIKTQLDDFLQSKVQHIESHKILTTNLHAYIFGCFRIDPYKKPNTPGRTTPADRHAVEVQVIREVLKDMVIVPSGILRVHVSTFHGPLFETPIRQGNLLWYRLKHNTKYEFKILNMVDAIAGLDLKVQQGHKRDRKPEIQNRPMQISDNDAQEVAEVRLAPEDVHLYTFTKDGVAELRVLFTTPDIDFPFPTWCDIQHAITEDVSVPEEVHHDQHSIIQDVSMSEDDHPEDPIPPDTSAKKRMIELLKQLENLIQNIPDSSHKKS